VSYISEHSKDEKNMSNLVETHHKITVLHIAGTGRNGSTLTERVLNEIPSFFAAGELAWADLFIKDKACFCGTKFDECPVWGSIRNDAIFKKIDEKSFIEASKRYRNIKEFFKLLLLKKTRRKMPEEFKQYLDSLQILYSVIQKYRACQVITDSSASFLYGYYLSLIPSIDFYVVHLVRDPRGFAHSHSRIKFSSENVSWSEKRNPLRSALSWFKKNLVIELFFPRIKGKYLRVRYEDFIENPTNVLANIGNMLGINLERFDFIQGKTVNLGKHHLTRGNIDAVIKGEEELVLKLDERWKRDMKWWNIVLVTLITWPLLLKYFIANKIMKKR
jgi:hypothetical protein